MPFSPLPAEPARVSDPSAPKRRWRATPSRRWRTVRPREALRGAAAQPPRRAGRRPAGACGRPGTACPTAPGPAPGGLASSRWASPIDRPAWAVPLALLGDGPGWGSLPEERIVPTERGVHAVEVGE